MSIHMDFSNFQYALKFIIYQVRTKDYSGSQACSAEAATLTVCFSAYYNYSNQLLEISTANTSQCGG